MRPHGDDVAHNFKVGNAFRDLIGQCLARGLTDRQIDHEIGREINLLAAAAYGHGQQEIQPSLN